MRMKAIFTISMNWKRDVYKRQVHAEDGDLETGMKKFGAMVGDRVEVGSFGTE